MRHTVPTRNFPLIQNATDAPLDIFAKINDIMSFMWCEYFIFYWILSLSMNLKAYLEKDIISVKFHFRLGNKTC